jgi:hypothetical protein
MAGSRYLNLRWAGRCVACGTDLNAGTRAWWDAGTRTVKCLDCRIQAPVHDLSTAPASSAGTRPTELVRSSAGSSAQREYERRHATYERRVRADHPVTGGVRLKLGHPPGHITAWAKGAAGEVRFGRRLDRLATSSIRVLHDRRVPGTRGNIDHLVVAPSAVFVIDTKAVKGRVERRDKGGFFRADRRLYVGGRDRSPMVDGMATQVRAVQRTLGSDDVPIVPALCFVEDNWGLFSQPFFVGGVLVAGPGAILRRIRRNGRLRGRAAELAGRLAHSLPPA